VYWHTKKQGSCETILFGSEFVATKQWCEYLKGLKYKLRMMGIPVSNPYFIYGDNQSVLWNTTLLESTLKKETASVAYHYMREGVSADAWRTTYVNTKLNPVDILTKNLHSGLNRYRKVRMILYDIYPGTNTNNEITWLEYEANCQILSQGEYINTMVNSRFE